MNRNLMRYTLIGLIVLATIWAAVPEITKALGVKVAWPSLGTISEKPVTQSACVDEGVTLVIDFGTGSQRKAKTICAATFGTQQLDTGWTLFAAGRIAVEGTADYPTGFVCRIDGFPNSQSERCEHVPGSNAGHWAYFTATDASGWHYSQIGSALSHPHCGNWQGWRFVPAGETRILPPRVKPEPFDCNG